MSKTDRRKTALFESIAVMGKAFASPRRLELLDLLAQGPRTVDQLAKASKQSVANASQHLQALHAAGLVTRERDGTKVRYELAGEDVLRLWLALRDTSAERLAEVERSARDYLGEEVEGIDREELLKRLRRRDVVVVDVRPSDEFEAGHIEGAQSIPLAELGAAPRRAPQRSRGDRLLSRPVLRDGSRGRSPPPGRRPARPAGSRRAGPSGTWPSWTRRASR